MSMLLAYLLTFASEQLSHTKITSHVHSDAAIDVLRGRNAVDRDLKSAELVSTLPCEQPRRLAQPLMIGQQLINPDGSQAFGHCSCMEKLPERCKALSGSPWSKVKHVKQLTPTCAHHINTGDFCRSYN
jgi:hypothetical protein